VTIVVRNYRPDVGQVPQLWQQTSGFGVDALTLDRSVELLGAADAFALAIRGGLPTHRRGTARSLGRPAPPGSIG